MLRRLARLSPFCVALLSNAGSRAADRPAAPAFQSVKFVVGGLPPGVDENYLYEYDAAFRLVKRHVLASGYTLMGIQTAAWVKEGWWFGCYGKPRVLLRADENFKLTGRWEFDASLGIEPLPDGRFLIGTSTATKGVGHTGRVLIGQPDERAGLILDKSHQ